MRLIGRLRQARSRRRARTLGMEAGVGFLVPDEPAVVGRLVGACPACGQPAEVSLVDLHDRRSHLSCPSCHHTWAIEHRTSTPPR